jgi:hypothetical protein
MCPRDRHAAFRAAAPSPTTQPAGAKPCRVWRGRAAALRVRAGIAHAGAPAGTPRRLCRRALSPAGSRGAIRELPQIQVDLSATYGVALEIASEAMGQGDACLHSAGREFS